MQKPNQPEDGLGFSDDLGELKRKSARGGLAFALTQGGLVVLQIAWTVVMARILTPADFGLAAMVMPLAAAIGVFSDMGLSQAVLQRRDLTYAHVSNLFWFSLAVQLCLFLLFLALSPLVGLFYGREEVTWMAAAYCSLFLINGLGALHRSVLLRRLQLARLGFMRLASSAIGAAAGVTVGVIWQTYWALVVMPIAGSIAGLILNWLFSGWRPRRPDRQTDIRSMIGFGGNVATTRLLGYVSANADTVLIGKVWGEVALGYYDRAYRLMVTPTNLITAPLANLAPTVFARLVDTPETYRRAVLGLMRLVLLGTVPGMTFAVVMAPALIPVVYGDAWDAVIPIFQAFGIAAVLRFQMVMLEWLFVAENRTRDLRNWAIARTVLVVGSMCIGLPWGGLGVAAAYAATALLFMVPLQVFWVTRGSPIRVRDIGLTFAMFLPGAILSIAAMEAVLRWGHMPGWASLLVGMALSYTLFWATAFAFPAGRRSFRMGLNVVRSRGKPGGFTG